jgi:hypothetical protein
LNGDSGSIESEEEMFGATDLETTPAGSVEKKVIYATGVLNYTIDSIYKLFLNLKILIQILFLII